MCLRRGRVLQNLARCGRRSARCEVFSALTSGRTRAVPWAHTHSDESRKARSRTHRHERAAGRDECTAHEDAETFFVAAGCVLCSRSFFFRVHPILCSAFQMQWRETPKCRAASACVRSACVATRRRKASQSSLWEVFGPGRLCVRPPGLSHRYTLASPTLNLRAASALLPPPRTKLTTRMRKSNEHLMLYSSRVQPLCLSVIVGLAIKWHKFLLFTTSLCRRVSTPMRAHADRVSR